MQIYNSIAENYFMSRSYRQQLRKLSSCDGKEQLTWQVAKRIAKRAEGRLHAYRCRFCQHWHVGNTVGNPKDDRKDQS